MEVYVTNHALEREFNDKLDPEDMIRFTKKLIKLYNLEEHQDGFINSKIINLLL